MATASIKRGLCNPCQLCCRKIDDTRNRRNLGIRSAECATASMDRLCGEVGLSREDIVPGPVCKKCFQDLEKLTKAQTTVDLLRARFLGYIRGHTRLLLPRSPVTQSAQPEPISSATQRKRTSSSADTSSPIAASTPSAHPPVRKRPLLVRETSKARKSLQFSPQGSVLAHNAEVTIQASPLVSVVSQTSKEFSCHCYGSYCINFLTFQIEVSESDARTEKKIYRVPSAVKKVTTSLVKGNYATFARNALKHPQLKRAIVSVVAAEVRRECQKMCTATEGQTSVLKRTSASEIKRFNWDDVIDELNKKAPVFSAILEASVKRFRKQHPKKVIQRSIGFAAAILLRERNKFMCAAQCVNSILLHAGHASKMVCIIICMASTYCGILV